MSRRVASLLIMVSVSFSAFGQLGPWGSEWLSGAVEIDIIGFRLNPKVGSNTNASIV